MNAIPPKGLKPDEAFDDSAFSLGEEAFVEAAKAAKSPFPQGRVPSVLAGIEVRLSVEVGSLRLSLKDLMNTEPGQLFALDKMTSEPVSVLVNGKPFARGEIVAMGERFGVRLLEIWPADPA